MAHRYIDAEQFKRDNERLLHCDFPYLAEETLEELIDNAPAADVQEVKRGRWISIGNTVMAKCSCGFFTDKWKTYRYCPNCGAKIEYFVRIEE